MGKASHTYSLELVKNTIRQSMSRARNCRAVSMPFMPSITMSKKIRSYLLWEARNASPDAYRSMNVPEGSRRSSMPRKFSASMRRSSTTATRIGSPPR